MSEKMEKPKLGETMYNSGVAYLFESFNNKSTAPFVTWIIEQNM